MIPAMNLLDPAALKIQALIPAAHAGRQLVNNYEEKYITSKIQAIPTDQNRPQLLNAAVAPVRLLLLSAAHG